MYRGGHIPDTGMSTLELGDDGRAVVEKVVEQDDLDLGMCCLGRRQLAAGEHDDGCHTRVCDALLQHLLADEASRTCDNHLHFRAWLRGLGAWMPKYLGR